MLDSRQIARLAVEARARVTWGDSIDVVRGWLSTEHVPHWQIEEILRPVLEERASSMRRRGTRDLFVGVLLLALAVTLVFLPQELEKQNIPAMGRFLGFFFAAAVFAGYFGVKQLIDGGERLLRGSRAPGAESDVSDA
jgi:hypothetical protein